MKTTAYGALKRGNMEKRYEQFLAPAATLISQNSLLRIRAPEDLFSTRWIVEKNFENAIHFAWHSGDDLVEPWTDLREKHAANIDYNDEYDYWSKVYSSVLEEYLDKAGFSDLYSDIEADIFHCCANIWKNGNDSFWDCVFAAYNAGFWPCGWGDAVYPAGKLIVFARISA